jgi:hypothetical protein
MFYVLNGNKNTSTDTLHLHYRQKAGDVINIRTGMSILDETDRAAKEFPVFRNVRRITTEMLMLINFIRTHSVLAS